MGKQGEGKPVLMAFKRRSERTDESNQERVMKLMASQADLFGPSGAAAKFLEMNVPVQGKVIREPVVGVELDYKTKLPKLNAYGQERKQLTVTIENNDGDIQKIYYKGGLLFSLRQALQEAGVSEVKVGGTIGSAWTSSEATDGGFDQKVYTTKYVPPTL